MLVDDHEIMRRIEATREIRSSLPATKVLMLTSFADDEAVQAPSTW